MRCARVTVFAVAAAVSFAVPAAAGPWARGEGDAFVSFQISAEEAPDDLMAGLWEPETYYSFYGEYGLGQGMTLGADIGAGDVSRQAVAFLRYTITPPEVTWQIAVDAGLGVRQLDDATPNGLLRLGASIGRGFGPGGGAWPMPMRHEGGWLTLDGYALYDLQIDEPIWQLEGTAGLRLSDRFAAVFSLKAEDWPGSDLLLSASPSLVFDLTETTSIQAGARAALLGQNTVGLSLSIWHEF